MSVSNVGIDIATDGGVDDAAHLATLIAGDARAHALSKVRSRELRKIGIGNQGANQLYSIGPFFSQNALRLRCIHDATGGEDGYIDGCLDSCCQVNGVTWRHMH